MKKNIIYGFVLLSTVSLNSFSAADLGFKEKFFNGVSACSSHAKETLYSVVKTALSKEMRTPVVCALAVGGLTAISYVGIKAIVKHFAPDKKHALAKESSSDGEILKKRLEDVSSSDEGDHKEESKIEPKKFSSDEGYNKKILEEVISSNEEEAEEIIFSNKEKKAEEERSSEESSSEESSSDDIFFVTTEKPEEKGDSDSGEFD